MSRKEPVRLWLKPGRNIWYIKDGSERISTGCSEGDREAAGRRLQEYIAKSYRPEADRLRDPSEIQVADVLNVYAAHKQKVGIANPRALGQRIGFLLNFWGLKTLAEINRDTCEEYVQHRGSSSAAGRELDDLKAACRYYASKGLCNALVTITRPKPLAPRLRWLTRDKAAMLIRAAWRYRQPQRGNITERHMRRHLVRFILVGLYTGTRAGAICNAALHPAIGRGYVDLKNGDFYRRGLQVAETKKRAADDPNSQPTASAHAPLGRHGRIQKSGGRVRRGADQARHEVVLQAGKGSWFGGRNPAHAPSYGRELGDAAGGRHIQGGEVFRNVRQGTGVGLRSSPPGQPAGRRCDHRPIASEIGAGRVGDR